MNGLISSISSLFNGNDALATIVMSLIPLIELKGGIVYAWEKLGFFLSFLYAYIGSTIVFIPVFFLLKPILNLLKKWKPFRGFATHVENYFENRAIETEEKQKNGKRKKFKSESFLKQLGVFIFVAIPLPMTGVWTGTAIAVFLGLKFREAYKPIALGNLVAGLLISGISALCVLIGIDLDLVLWILFALAVIILIITVVKISTQKTNKKESE